MRTYRRSVIIKFLSLILSALLLLNTVGCNSYYKPVKLSAADKPNLDNIGIVYKYVILHHGQNVFALKEISVDMQNISGVIEPVSKKFHYIEDKTAIYTKNEENIFNEVHIYLNENSVMPVMGNTTISLKDVSEVRVIDKDTARTVVIFVIKTAAVVGVVFLIVLIIALLTKSSCPYVYVHNGENFVFEGETYGGAIASNLERDDFMPLPSINPVNDSFRIRISNELKECQHTDIAQLLIAEHKKDQKVLLDKYGRAQFIGEPQAPVEALSSNGDNLESILKEKDNEVYLFNDENYLKNSITMKFRKPENTENGKLLLKAKNSLWFDYIFGDFLSKFGKSYDNWMERQSKIEPAERQRKVLENDFPLTVYIKKNHEWCMIDYLYTIGPLASREFVVPVELAGTGEDIEIKLETGFMFWEADYAAMDFSENSELRITTLDPVTAVDEKGIDRKDELIAADGNYMIQNYAGLSTEVTYKAEPVKEGMIRTVFLHTRGYYELIREFTGLPDLIELNKFKTPGYFSEYSRAEYLKALNKNEQIMCIKPVN